MTGREFIDRELATQFHKEWKASGSDLTFLEWNKIEQVKAMESLEKAGLILRKESFDPEELGKRLSQYLV